MPIQNVREVIGSDKIIGGTANTLADCKNVELFGGDYIGLGPFRKTSTKKKLSPILGIEGFKSIIPKDETYGWDMLNFNIPIVAIGGLKVDDINLLKQHTGIYGVALSGLIYKSTNKKVLVDELKKILY
jgi:thiamine-phosphate pyrophosphorylase